MEWCVVFIGRGSEVLFLLCVVVVGRGSGLRFGCLVGFDENLKMIGLKRVSDPPPLNSLVEDFLSRAGGHNGSVQWFRCANPMAAARKPPRGAPKPVEFPLRGEITA